MVIVEKAMVGLAGLPLADDVIAASIWLDTIPRSTTIVATRDFLASQGETSSASEELIILSDYLAPLASMQTAL
jgi:hypothetical protein